jgi:membrane protein DedA with SNARE-associated domain
VSISSLIANYGYWAVFLLVAVESLGIPLPGETALITAGIYAGHTHRLNPWLIFAVAAAGAIIGDNIGYWIGDKGGYRLALRYGPKVRLDERKLKIARYLFDTHGGKVVFFGRFVSVLRTYAAFLAGTSKMRWRRFFVANASGGILWAGIYTFAAYFFGHTLQQVSGILDWALIGVAVAAIVAIVVLIRRETDRLAVRAEAAYPGPLSAAPAPSRRAPPSPRANAGPKVPPPRPRADGSAHPATSSPAAGSSGPSPGGRRPARPQPPPRRT